MKQISSLNEIYNSSWGILADKRQEVEAAPFGQFDKIYDNSIKEKFYTIDEFAEAMDCCRSTVTKRLKKDDIRFVQHGKKHLYPKDEADLIIKKYKKVQRTEI